MLIDRSTYRVEEGDAVLLGPVLDGGAVVGGALGEPSGVLLGVADRLGVGVADPVVGGGTDPVPGQADGSSVAGELPVTTVGAGAASGRTRPAAPAATTTAAAT
ncbi:hypothetical protein, partial [Micromonospora sp. NPDC003776]